MTPAELLTISSTSLLVATAATAVILVPGVLLAWLFARCQFRGKTLLQTLVSLPMVLPPVAVGLILLQALSRRGPLGRWLHESLSIDLVFTWQGAALASAAMALPLLVRAAEVAFAAVPRRLEQVAATLGAGPIRVFFTVTLPLARRGLAYGLVLAFTRALGEFGATSLVAGNIPGRTETFALGIYSRVQTGEDGAAWLLCGVSLLLCFVSLFLAEAYLRHHRPDPVQE